MRRTRISIAICMLALAIAPLRAAEAPNSDATVAARKRSPKPCSLSTLQGVYILTARLDAPSYAPMAGVPQVVGGLRTFDGAGSITGVATVNAGGTIMQNVRAPGVYTLNPDCTGTMTNAGTRHYDLFGAPDGSQAVAIRTDPGMVEILKFTKVSGDSEN